MSLRKAIERQQELIAASPHDVQLLQKLGELFQKAGDVDAAAETFSRVAMHYGRDGFFLKAVAVMQQVLKMDPGLVVERERLANWYESLQLGKEAAAEYRTLLQHYQVTQAADDAARVAEALSRLHAPIDPGGERN